MKYLDQLKSPKWQKKRLEILSRDNWTCKKCGDKDTELHVHHLKYSGKPYESNNDDLITLCKHCHLLFTETESLDINLFKSVCKEIESQFYVNMCFIYNGEMTGIYSIRYDEISGIPDTNCIILLNNSEFSHTLIKILQNG